uniref:Uncharacterized protein n=1 Tax=Pseudomonas fluorescens (strain SBW25) TaxID=216595 RepID=A0A0G4E3X4_PSEFS|nr:hypothetical protein PQBR57_0003 [Pseudomonas fluorescens SBW25]
MNAQKQRQTPSPGQEFVLPQASYEDGLTISTFSLTMT